MTDPLLFTVSGSVAARAQPLTLAEAGLTERAHLQEWVLANPDILGSDVRVLSFEFDWWTGSGGSRERDRLDVLGIDTAGRLVVAELKRDRAPNTTDTQAIRYAAMASRFTSDTLAAAHARFLSARGEPTDADAALRVIEDHAGGELDTELLRRPRIVLVAADFPAALTASAVWLTEMGIRVELVQYRAYRAGGEVALVVSRLWPVADVEDFTVSPDAVEAASPAARSEVRRRAGSAVKRLVDAAALENGTVLELNATTEVDAEARDQIAAWVEAQPERGRATWHNDVNAPLEWHHDGQRYTPTGLARLIIAEATGMERGPRGTSWWITEDGDDLVALADTVAPTDSAAAGRYQPRDWSDLHAAPRTEAVDHLRRPCCPHRQFRPRRRPARHQRLRRLRDCLPGTQRRRTAGCRIPLDRSHRDARPARGSGSRRGALRPRRPGRPRSTCQRRTTP